MKLLNHVLDIRHLIQLALANQFDRLGLQESGITDGNVDTLDKMNIKSGLINIISDHEKELGDYPSARQFTINECVFTLFNRIAAVKVMEAKELFPTIITTSAEFANHSFGHQAWLQENPGYRNLEREGLAEYLQEEFEKLGEQIPLFHKNYPYQLFPTADELYQIIQEFNAVELDPDCGADVWRGDDILGWLYENFNAVEKEALKASGEKTEYNKVSLQSQVYTPQWVVKFLVDNTLGKEYLEMYPDSEIVNLTDAKGEPKYRIANAPTIQERKPKKMTSIRVIDPACGSGNFLIYSFSLLYDMYLNQMEQYGAEYSRRDIPKMIVENNIYGVDLDERAVQLSQIALFIKARELGGRRAPMPQHTNVVSSHFFLPEYEQVKSAFDNQDWNERQKLVLKMLWDDLSTAYKFGSLIRVETSFKKLENADSKEKTLNMFAGDESFDVDKFKKTAIARLRDQVKISVAKRNNGYTLTKTEDALRFLDILTTPFDVVVANPPYTDSSDFGEELKAFVDANYKKPLAFNSNLYACFIKRCCELAGDKGKVGMIHPMTFMYIKTFEDVRKFMLEKTHISLFTEYGLSNLFGAVMVDPAFYTLEMGKKESSPSFFISLDQYTRTPEEKNKKTYCLQALTDVCSDKPNKHVYQLPQEKLKQIKSFPFIYWISDEFREKFSGDDLDGVVDIRQGLATGDNNRFLRYWWEVIPSTISQEYGDKKKWVKYSKGGPYNKWYGNFWTIVNWGDDGFEVKNFKDEKGKLRSRPQNEDHYFNEGLTYTSVGSKGISVRYMPSNYIIDVGGSGIYPNKFKNVYYILGLMNSNLAFYTCDCLNPTVNTNQGDLKRIPFALPSKELEDIVTNLVKDCVAIKTSLYETSLVEMNYNKSAIVAGVDVLSGLHEFYVSENAKKSIILLNEVLINQAIFKVYDLSEKDLKMIEEKEGVLVGSLPVSESAKEAFLNWMGKEQCPISSLTSELVNSLPISDYNKIDDFDVLYQSHNEWEEFCIRHHMNPIEVWYQFTQSNVLPSQRTQVLSFELLVDVVRAILAKDDDGVIPLIDSLGEARLGLRIEQELHERGYSSAQISQIFQLLGMSLDKFLQERFFAQLSDHLNLFMYLPKTPFIWHLTSGPKRALDLFISIYTWNRDTLYRVKSVYTANREASLRDQIAQLRSSEDQSARARANDVQEQLDELMVFSAKLDDLLASGYDPKLDDGVGKNIAPLQKRGLIAFEVHNANQLKKYLNADW